MELTKDILKIILDVLQLTYYFTAGPLLVYIAIKGLKQIKVAKQNSKTINKREAFKCAAEQCGVFAEKIVPLTKELENENLTFFKKFNVSFTEEGSRFKISKIEEIKEKDIYELMNSENLIKLTNALEAFSVYFVSGVAAEKVGYITLGKLYCKIVKMLIPVLEFCLEKDSYTNLKLLFSKWNSRLDKV